MNSRKERRILFMINVTYFKTLFLFAKLEQVSMPKAKIFHVRCFRSLNIGRKKLNQNSSDISEKEAEG